MKGQELNPDGCELLREAIIKQAVVDYRKTLLKIVVGEEPKGTEKKKKDYREKLFNTVAELRAFFASDWFEFLCDLEGPKIQKSIETQVRKDLHQRVAQIKKRRDAAEKKIGDCK